MPNPFILLLSLEEKKVTQIQKREKELNSHCYTDSSGSWFCHNPLFLELLYICL